MCIGWYRNFPGGSVVKYLPVMQETQEIRVQSLGQEDPLEMEMAAQYSCLENLMDWGAWWATVHGVTKSQMHLSDWAQHRVHMCGRHLQPVSISGDKAGLENWEAQWKWTTSFGFPEFWSRVGAWEDVDRSFGVRLLWSLLCLTLLQPGELEPSRLLRPRDFPGKNTGVGCQVIKPCKVERKIS